MGKPAGVFSLGSDVTCQSVVSTDHRRTARCPIECNSLLRSERAGRCWAGKPNRACEAKAVTQRAIHCIEQNIARPRKETGERIIKAFAKAGLAFERLSRGGFKMTVTE